MALRKSREGYSGWSETRFKTIGAECSKKEDGWFGNYACSDGYNSQGVVGEQTQATDGQSANWHKEDERTWGHDYSNSGGVRVRGSRYDRDFG
jgi:hypothetical protein